MTYKCKIRMLKEYFSIFNKTEKEKIIKLLMNFEHYKFINNYNTRSLIILIEDLSTDTIYEFVEFVRTVL
jgi:hypothetical protein